MQILIRWSGKASLELRDLKESRGRMLQAVETVKCRGLVVGARWPLIETAGSQWLSREPIGKR